MTIQVITDRTLQSENSITISRYSKPMALDDFDMNFIDLSTEALWYYNKNYDIGLINSYSDLHSIKKMVSTTKKAKIIYVYPQNFNYCYDYDYDYSRQRNIFQKSMKLKQMMTKTDCKTNMGKYIPNESIISETIYEPTKTKIGDIEYDAEFHFSDKIGIECISKSLRSEKVTTIKYDNNLYVTTLDVCKTIDDIKNFINNLFKNENISALPEWVKEYNFRSDKKTKELLKNKNDEIIKLQNEINDAEKVLEENNKYKSILCNTGDKLVEVVFEILEKLLDYDLSQFKDEKKEDFLVEKDNVIFIGEIKGVSSNVKSEHVSQLDVHYNKYKDEHEIIDDDNICALLIINPFRDNSLENREPINKEQISLAIRNKSLIVETKTLLKIFEMFNNNILNTENIIDILKSKAGLLQESDINKFMNI